MSIAIARPSLRLVNIDDYEPVSDSSRTIQGRREIEKNVLSGSASDWLPIIEPALREIDNECRKANWDGDGAVPITSRTIELTERIAAVLFDLLPKGTPAPDLVPESDGEICLSWSVDASNVLSLSIGEHGKINFAAHFGKDGGVHAWRPVDATNRGNLEESVGEVVRYIAKLYAPAPLRRAA